jgi:hypothetical protein
MDRGAMLFGATLFIVLAALTSIASSKTGDPDTNGAVASALKHHLTELVGAATIEGKDASFGPLVLCVGSKVPLKMEAIERDFAGTVIEPVPANACTSEKIEGDFGMFTAITKYHDATGAEAAHLEVENVACSSTRTCIVDIDDFGSGDRYITRREGQVWSVVERRMRWVV